MRYVIVSLVNGEAGKFNNRLRRKVYEEFKAKSSKLPAHFTIKSPFEYDGDITDLETLLDGLTCRESAKPYYIKGYDHFDDRVIYMSVSMSKEGKDFHDRLIDEMQSIPYIKFSEKDGKDKVFHVTVSSKKIKSIYYKLWEYVNSYPCSFECNFDNITIYNWENNTWNIYKEFRLKEG